MATELSSIVDRYIQATNEHDAAAFMGLFAEGAVVHDAGREHVGRQAIKDWSDREVFAAEVTLEVLSSADHDGRTVVTTKVDGNFDRTGLPHPLLIDHHITIADGKIVALDCQLVGH